MADVLVTGIKIGDMPLKGTVSGNEKLPTGDVGDLAVTPNQIKDFTIAEGNLVNQEQLDDAIESVEQTSSGLAGRVQTLENRTSNVDNTADLDKPISNATQAALNAKADKVDVDAKLDLKADKDKVVSSFNGQVGEVILNQSDLVELGEDFSTTPIFQDVPKLTNPDGSSIPEFDSQIQPLVNSLAVHRQGLTPTFDQAYAAFIGGYPLNARLMLDNGDIVRSTVANNTTNPNVDMAGWVKTNSASQIFDESGESQQEINDLSGHSRLMFKDYADIRGYSGLGTRIFVSNKWLRGSFIYDSSDASSVDNGGTIIVDSLGRRWKREFSGAVKAYWFGAPTGVNDQVQINKAIIAAVDCKELVDLRGAAWGINGTIRFNELSGGYISDRRSTITVNVGGTFESGYVVEIGDPTKAYGSGRVVAFKCQGHLIVNASSRSIVLNGVYLKGAWLNIDFIRATNFNGTGIYADSVWDSKIDHFSTELCGNATTYALRLYSNGDTFNASTVNTIQCEQSQGKGLYLNCLRTTINTIHAERLTVIDVGQVQNSVTLSNSTLNQAILDSLTSDEINEINAPSGTVQSVLCSGTVRSTFGLNHNFKSLVCKDYLQSGTAQAVTLDSCRIGTLKTLDGTTILNSTITTYNPTFNSRNVSFVGGSISSIACTSNILGNISYYGTKIGTIGETKNPAAGYSQMEFHGCTVDTYNGAFNANAKFIGGRIKTAAIASQAKPVFIEVEFTDFSSSGNRSYITKGCTATGAVTWNTPNFAMQAGTLTERIGYSTDGKIYQNTDGATNWVKLA